MGCVDENREKLESQSKSLSSILEDAKNLYSSIPPDNLGARKLFNKALRLDQNNVDVLDSYGEFLCTIGDTDMATQLFQRSILLQPESGPMKYFYIGQLSDGYEALNYFKTALEIIEKKSTEIEDSSFDKNKILADICCSIAELYLSDLSNDENAEKECSKYINMATLIDPHGFDSNSCFALFNKIKNNKEVAINAANKCLDLLSKQRVNQENDLSSIAEISIDSRINFCRTLIDLDMVDEASDILENCLEEDEDNIETWYVLGCANIISGEIESTEQCLSRMIEINNLDQTMENTSLIENLTNLINNNKELKESQQKEDYKNDDQQIELDE